MKFARISELWILDFSLPVWFHLDTEVHFQKLDRIQLHALIYDYLNTLLYLVM